MSPGQRLKGRLARVGLSLGFSGLVYWRGRSECGKDRGKVINLAGNRHEFMLKVGDMSKSRRMRCRIVGEETELPKFSLT